MSLAAGSYSLSIAFDTIPGKSVAVSADTLLKWSVIYNERVICNNYLTMKEVRKKGEKATSNRDFSSPSLQ